MIHGGPTSPELPTSWAFQGGWEDYFTVEQWDQRGSGKTYNANDPARIAPTLSRERITEDAVEVVQYLRRRYGKEKVFVLGHSWGSLVGLGLPTAIPSCCSPTWGWGRSSAARRTSASAMRSRSPRRRPRTTRRPSRS
ncbi:alpha/beta fold hydrolase [Corallococcus sp. NCRR]|uniref:alpha/beta fold hydrolase n=1 Tax=Corallococcus sp. NCRR TaxID=2996782 RepID=UPI003FA44EBB